MNIGAGRVIYESMVIGGGVVWSTVCLKTQVKEGRAMFSKIINCPHNT